MSDADYDAAHLKDSGSGIDDSGEREAPRPPVTALDEYVTVCSTSEGMLLTDTLDNQVLLTGAAFQALVAYVEKWK